MGSRDVTDMEVEWRVEPAPVAYRAAVAAMEARATEVRAGTAPELVWLLEHPPVVTAGTSARMADLLDTGRFPLEPSGRGGQLTFHGPGQRVVYLVLDLARRGRDVRHFVFALEAWAIDALARLGVVAGRDPRGTGVWIADQPEARKLCAIGVRVRKWVSLHGMAINVATDLSAFDAIVACGIPGARPARLADHLPGVTMGALDDALAATLGPFLERLAAGASALEARALSR